MSVLLSLNVHLSVPFVFTKCVGNCDGAVPEGVQTRSRVCRDQDGIRHPVCSGSITEDCCTLDGMFFSGLVVACNPNCSKLFMCTIMNTNVMVMTNKIKLLELYPFPCTCNYYEF